jgi:hypothetical protein
LPRLAEQFFSVVPAAATQCSTNSLVKNPFPLSVRAAVAAACREPRSEYLRNECAAQSRVPRRTESITGAAGFAAFHLM